MIQSHRISILAPLGVGVVAWVCTIVIYLLPLRATINLVRRERRHGRVGMPWSDLGIFARVVFYASLAHFLEIGFWAVLLMICGEFSDFGTVTPSLVTVGAPNFFSITALRPLGPSVMIRSPVFT